MTPYLWYVDVQQNTILTCDQEFISNRLINNKRSMLFCVISQLGIKTKCTLSSIINNELGPAMLIAYPATVFIIVYLSNVIFDKSLCFHRSIAALF